MSSDSSFLRPIILRFILMSDVYVVPPASDPSRCFSVRRLVASFRILAAFPDNSLALSLSSFVLLSLSHPLSELSGSSGSHGRRCPKRKLVAAFRRRFLAALLSLYNFFSLFHPLHIPNRNQADRLSCRPLKCQSEAKPRRCFLARFPVSAFRPSFPSQLSGDPLLYNFFSPFISFASVTGTKLIA